MEKGLKDGEDSHLGTERERGRECIRRGREIGLRATDVMDPGSFARPSLPCPVHVTSSANAVAEQPSTTFNDAHRR